MDTNPRLQKQLDKRIEKLGQFFQGYVDGLVKQQKNSHHKATWEEIKAAIGPGFLLLLIERVEELAALLNRDGRLQSTRDYFAEKPYECGKACIDFAHFRKVTCPDEVKTMAQRVRPGELHISRSYSTDAVTKAEFY